MKYLLFNGVVAAALIYLVAGDKIDLNNPMESFDSVTEQISEPVSGDASVAYQQTVMETARQVATITAKRVAEETTNRLLQENVPQDTPIAELSPVEALPEVQEEYVSVTPDYVIDEASAVDGTDVPIIAEFEEETSEPTIQLAEGEQFMSARDRQKELDALAQNMEFLFLSTQ